MDEARQECENLMPDLKKRIFANEMIRWQSLIHHVAAVQAAYSVGRLRFASENIRSQNFSGRPAILEQIATLDNPLYLHTQVASLARFPAAVDQIHR